MNLLDDMTKDGSRLYALVNDDAIVALAGISIRVNFSNKRHVFIYDLVTDVHRSHRYGGKLLKFIHLAK